MELLLLVVMFLLVAASLWFSGFWSSFVSTINMFLAACFATAFFEPLADQIEYASPATQTYTYMIDFVALWAMFVIAAMFIRAATESFSAVRLRFDPVTEMAGRSVMSVAAGLIFVCFAQFTLVTAPLPESGSHKGSMLAPDRIWMGFTQSRSRGALAEAKDPGYLKPYKMPPGLAEHPDDAGLNARVFDPRGVFEDKYLERKKVFAEQKTQRVSRKSK